MKNKSAKILASSLVLLLAACTVTPSRLKDSSASFDRGVLNSGLIGFTNHNDVRVAIITPHALERYNGLIERYGKKFIPPLNKSRGVCTNCIDGLILMQKQDLVNFQTMNRWRKEDYER
jgi:hypothetical protein